MDIKHKKMGDGLHGLTFQFEKGEKCFCCSKIFTKKTDVSQTFSSDKEFEEYVSTLQFYYNINIYDYESLQESYQVQKTRK